MIFFKYTTKEAFSKMLSNIDKTKYTEIYMLKKDVIEACDFKSDIPDKLDLLYRSSEISYPKCVGRIITTLD